MKLRNTDERKKACEIDETPCEVSKPATDEPLFERHWEEFVIKRDRDGKFHSFTECCGYLTPA